MHEKMHFITALRSDSSEVLSMYQKHKTILSQFRRLLTLVSCVRRHRLRHLPHACGPFLGTRCRSCASERYSTRCRMSTRILCDRQPPP